jgi:hypothetical protein
MKVKKTSAAIIDGVLVPAGEVAVLRTLVKLGRPATVPEIAKAMSDAVSDASLYTLLGRLAEQRELVTRAERLIDVQGTTFRRIFWSPIQAAVTHFRQVEDVDVEPTEEKPPRGAPA